ncbi:hypothetical protein DH2020_013286 [Rehmannia glutinosa]|uniref:Isochorismatase-like domain-containing protein n=1 Tax=Rehmannia glutinosa TaxID=99300 RepID=A0ABR0X1T9_REHGL
MAEMELKWKNTALLVIDMQVVREHDPLGRDVELFRRHLYSVDKPKPTSKGSVGAELVDGLMIKDGDYKLVKTRFSAFFNTHLHSYLQGAGINKLVIIGVQTPNCIRQTVFDAVALDYQTVTVIVDATAAATPDIHININIILKQYFSIYTFTSNVVDMATLSGNANIRRMV